MVYELYQTSLTVRQLLCGINTITTESTEKSWQAKLSETPIHVTAVAVCTKTLIMVLLIHLLLLLPI